MASSPSTHAEAVQRQADQYKRLTSQGGFVPNTYPLDSLMLLIPVVYLLLPQRYSSRRSRLATLAALSIAALYHVLFTRAQHPSTAALVGIFNVYIIMWGLAHIGFIDAKTEHARIVAVDAPPTNGRTVENNSTDSTDSNTAKLTDHASLEQDGSPMRTYQWQSLPASLVSRVDWVSDLFTSLDGAGWTWAVPSLSAPPARVRKTLARDTQDHGFDAKLLNKKWSRLPHNDERVTASETYSQAVKDFWIGYIIADVLKTLVCLDPWFFGVSDAPPPPYIPWLLRYAWIVRGVRLLIGQGCVHYTISNVVILRTVGYLAPAIRSHIGVRGEAWMHSGPFGRFRFILDKGLLGFWSNYWHQSFRYVFTAPTRAITRHFNIHPASLPAQVIRLFVAFICSGILHASISYTSLGESKPLSGSFLFFALQPVGIIIQIVFADLVFRTPLARWLLRWACQVSNLAWALWFGYMTGPLLIEDLARGGCFLLQPIPFSPLRGLGFGRKGDGFFCWAGDWFQWTSNGLHTGLQL